MKPAVTMSVDQGNVREDELTKEAREMPVASLDLEALEHAVRMVRRYRSAVARHPRERALTRAEEVEVSNLAHWQRRLDAIQSKDLLP